MSLRPTADYRVLVGDLIGATELKGELAFESFTYADILNDPGYFDGLIYVGGGRGATIRSLLRSARTSLYVERNGRIVWGGIVWLTMPGLSYMQVHAEGFASYAYRRRQRVTSAYTNPAWDKAQIIRDQWVHLQAQPNGSIGVATPALANSGRLMNLVVPHWEGRSHGSICDEVSDSEPGCDWAVVVNPFLPAGKTLQVWGRRGSTKDYVFEYPGNLVDPKETEDGLRTTNAILAEGAGEGSRKLRVYLGQQADTTAAGFPLLEGLLVRKDQKRADSLSLHATAARARTRWPVSSPRAQVLDSPTAPFGSYGPGDDMVYRCVEGAVNLNGLYRLQGWEVAVDANRVETITHQVAIPEAFV